MKRFLAPLCLVLTLVAPASHAVAAPVGGIGLGLKLGVELAIAADAGDPDKWRRRHDGDDNNNNNNDDRGRRDDNNRGGWGGGRGGGEDRSDNRINRAMAIASSRGRVLDAGQQGGSIFWVRVATDHGRVDLLVDTDSGRIIGER